MTKQLIKTCSQSSIEPPNLFVYLLFMDRSFEIKKKHFIQLYFLFRIFFFYMFVQDDLVYFVHQGSYSIR